MRASASIDQIDGDIGDPSGSTNPRRSRSDGESRTERTIGMRPIMGRLVRMMEEKAKNLNLEPLKKKLK